MKKVFCEECREMTNYYVKNEEEKKEINGKTIAVDIENAHCTECDSLLFVEEIHDRNLLEINKELDK